MGLTLVPVGALYGREGGRRRDQVAHPEPRPGIDASSVLAPDELADVPHALEAYDAVREIPHIVDGIRCGCGCSDLPGNRSLLSCFEKGGMARYCAICRDQALLAHGRWKEGQSLERIRRAIDARFGPDPEHAHAHGSGGGHARH